MTVGFRQAVRSTLFALLGGAAVAAGADTPAGLSDASQAAEPMVVLRAAHVFDAVSGRIRSPGEIVVQGKKIAAIGPGLAVAQGARVVDLGDATLLPGFIDAHVHLDDEMGPDWYRDFYNNMMRFPAERALRGAYYSRITLEAGITTVRNVGDNDHVALGLRNAIARGDIPGPRILTANYAIGSSGGHADSDPIPPERVALSGPDKGVCNGPDECRAAVRYQIKFGADVIKFMPSGGVLSLSDPVDNVQLTQDEMNAIVSEAHAWGRKVAAHCHGDRAAKMAIAAGVDSIEHGSFLQDDTLELMKQKHVYLVPTLSAGYWVGRKADSYPAAIGVKARAASAQMRTMFTHAVRIGTPIAMGTDAAVGPHGTNTREFVLMAEGGMAPLDALMAGTANGADLLGVESLTGRLKPGLSADIIAVPGDPSQDIHAVEHPILVMKEGRIYKAP